MAVKKSRKCSGVVIYSYFNSSAFTADKRDAKFYATCRYVKGVPFVNRRPLDGIRKEYLFCEKWYIKE